VLIGEAEEGGAFVLGSDYGVSGGEGAGEVGVGEFFIRG